MRKSGLWYFVFCASLSLFLFSCKDEETLKAPVVSDQSFVEEFDTMQSAYNRGWRWINTSVPLGNSDWKQAPGSSVDMAAYSFKNNATGAAYANYLSTNGTDNGIISNWLISPVVTMQNGDRIIFYTKSQRDFPNDTDWGCRLQLCLNKKNGDLLPGEGEDAGNFKEVLLDINPFEEANQPSQPSPVAYPGGWTRFEATVYGLSAPSQGRFAFRYFLHGAGNNGAGYGVGIDSVAYVGKH